VSAEGSAARARFMGGPGCSLWESAKEEYGMKAPLCAIVLVLLISCPPVMAEVYQYRDKAGRLHFTDDITRVPDDQRPPETGKTSVIPIPDVVPAVPEAAMGQEPAAPSTAGQEALSPGPAAAGRTATEAAVAGEVAESAPKRQGGEATGAPETEGDGETRTPPDRRMAVTVPDKQDGPQTLKAGDELEARNTVLKKEFQELMAEKDRLEGQRAKLNSKEQRKAFEELVKGYNQRVDAYEAQRNKLNEEITVHNEEMMKSGQGKGGKEKGGT
jgi:hypothetical protein